MNDFVNIVLKDIYSIVDKLIDNKIIDNSFNKSTISIDYFSKSKKGDIATNLFIVLKKFFRSDNSSISVE